MAFLARWRRRRRVARDPGAALLQALRGVLERDLDSAEALLRELAERDSSIPGFHLALGSLYRNRGEINRAIRVHQNLLLRPDLDAEERVAALRGLAEDFQQGGLLQRAIAAYEELRTELPRDASVRVALADLYEQIRDYPKAMALLRRAGDLPESERTGRRTRIALAWADQRARSGDDAQAGKILRRALRQNPEHAETWVRLGDLEASRGRTKRAVRAWQRGLELDRDHSRALHPKLADAFRELDRTDEYEVWLRRAIEQKPHDLDARIALARSLADRGEEAAALEELAALDADHPEHLEVQVAYARALAAADAPSEALERLLALCDRMDREGWFARRDRLA